MNVSGARPKRHSRNDDNQSDGNEGSDGKDDDRNRNIDQDNDNSEQSHDNDGELGDGTPHNEIDAQNEKSASSDGSKRVSPILFEEREPKKSTTSSYKPPRRYPNRDSLLNRHRDLAQENKRLLASTVTRNSSLAPLLRDGAGLGGILGDIPDYYTDEVTVQFLNAQVRSLKEELETLIRECVDKDEMILLLEQRLKETEIDRTKLQRENSNKEQQIEKLQKTLDETKEKCDRIKKELSFVNKETDILKQGQRQAASLKSSLEAKLTRASEENERNKNEIRQLKQANKEAQENYQRKMEELSTENRRIDKQNSELHNAIKKQMQLINNLKRQKMHVEAATAVQFSEDEFMKALDRGT
ncbi:testis-expressed protein 9 isoform X2 [Parasteatoda tepidariorum]|nr:testis-expressed protein 9 isoform X2 [Parasteatoda tepidariorum]XP_015928614.1 testis-expressed protein 9 isoform X2 [Parasteatoda tepidariorum]XP_042902125.1 testis-expressed protein 9 isoform X2 [Parasteatoda tepidariorum]XP_042902126.1 testis-expressed protein 9 isoform X2 [Parasteatoda tepidariorum]